MRQSNVDRDQWRILCRERLSAHIRWLTETTHNHTCVADMIQETTLGITVKPSEVRLNPGPNDPYAWNVLPEKRRIFSEIFNRNLSQHSINAYKTLCEGVGRSFEAVHATTNHMCPLDHLTSVSSTCFICRDPILTRH